MAQLQQKPDTGKGGRKRSNRFSSSPDMTPMVDLACLLVTFFMLTTSFHKLQTMQISMPVPGAASPVGASDALTVILGENDKLYYYYGLADDKPEMEETDLSANGIRKVLVSDKVKANPKLVVLIKAMETSRYSNLVDVFDEMKITGTKKYALVDIDEVDRKLIASK
ncbi:ExbD/TolR family protein [Pontibacter ruber]|uniref:ExbD/TolR family protein n=1 Tax=Pontibacter ruber TaxID=1343895 RepID=A0ABW5CZR6_9BACT|nr:biopolymer transporter ExbD [Pontibacter ruber]